MIKKLNRHHLVAQDMRKNIATILHRKIRDPRIKMMTTISNVEISRDLAHAKIFVMFFHDKDEQMIETSVKVLQNASGFIRFLLGKMMNLRVLPKLTFYYDNSLIEGIRIEKLAVTAVEYDEKRRLRSR